MLDLELGRRDELAVRCVREVGAGIDLARHQHGAVHREAAVLAHHRLTAHLHGGGAERAEQAAEVQHEGCFLAESHLSSSKVAALLEGDGVGLTLDLDEDAEVGQERTRHEERDLVGRRELRFGRARRLGVFEQSTFNSERQAVDQRLDWPVVFEASEQPVGPSGAGDLEARHMELLAEAIQPRWASVTGVALQIVLAGKRGHTLGGRDPRRRDQRDADSGAHERGGHRHARERAFEHRFSSRGRQGSSVRNGRDRIDARERSRSGGRRAAGRAAES